MNDPGLEQRFEQVETRLAYEEETLRVLNEVVTAQQARIERLELLCRQLAERLRQAGEPASKGTPADEVPPHY